MNNYFNFNGDSVYEKEINLEDAIKVATNQIAEGIYYFLGENDYRADGAIDGHNNIKEEIEFDQSILDTENKYLELSKIILENGGQIFCMYGFILDNSEIGENGFTVNGRFEDHLVESSSNFTNGGYGLYIKKIGDKYMCDFGIYFLQPTFPHGPADESFKHFSNKYSNDPVGEIALKELESYF